MKNKFSALMYICPRASSYLGTCGRMRDHVKRIYTSTIYNKNKNITCSAAVAASQTTCFCKITTCSAAIAASQIPHWTEVLEHARLLRSLANVIIQKY